jgi:hypothetical protein
MIQAEHFGDDFKPAMLLYGLNFKRAFASLYRQNHIQKFNAVAYTSFSCRL